MVNPVLQLNESLSWIFESYKIYKESPETTIGDSFKKYVIDGKCTLINHGLLLAACYLYFLYPKEKGKRDIYIDTKIFVSDYKEDDFVRRIRNALAHAKIEIRDNGNICFKDNNKEKTDPFEAEINPVNLANLVEKIGKGYAKNR